MPICVNTCTSFAAVTKSLQPGTSHARIPSRSGYYGPIDPDRASAATRLVLDGFFTRFLSGTTAGTDVLDNPQAIDPDVQLLQ